MKNRVIEKINNNNYIYVAILAVYIALVICISLLLSKVSSKNIDVLLNGTKLELDSGIIKIKGTRYITRNDIEKNFSNHIFYDKISRTLIITAWDEKVKIKKDAEGTIEYEAETVYSVKMLAEKMKLGYIEDSKTNDIYIYNNLEQDASLKKNRTEVYDVNSNSVVSIVNKDARIILLETASVYTDSKDKLVLVKITETNGKTYIGRIRKEHINYTAKNKDIGLDKQEEIVMVCVEDKLSKETDLTKVNTLAVNMLKLTNANKVEKIKYTLPDTKGLNVYAVIDNNYKSAGFDTNIITDLVHSDVNKEIVAMYLIDFVLENELEGIILDFKKFKASDKDLLEQYIKELAVLMHANDKKFIVKMASTETYDINDIKDYVDYVVIETYGTRTTASKQAGPHASLTHTTRTLIDFSKTALEISKLILEVSTNSILWTERGGTVINAEMYTMKAAKEYIKENNIEVVFNESARQNYASHTKGVVTYKMWVEDLESFEAKYARAHVNGLAGISIYKSGEELKEIYSVIDKVREEYK